MPTLIADYLIEHGATIKKYQYDDKYKRYTFYIHDIKNVTNEELHDIICKAYHLDNIPDYITLKIPTKRLDDNIDYYIVYSKTPLTTLEGVDDRQFQIRAYYEDVTPRDKEYENLDHKLFNIWLDYIS